MSDYMQQIKPSPEKIEHGCTAMGSSGGDGPNGIVYYCKRAYPGCISDILDDRFNNRFISTWKTDNVGVSSSNQIKLPLLSSGDYAMTVAWGDGKSDKINAWDDAAVTHSYAAAGTYRVVITGRCRGFRFNDAGDKGKILDVARWGHLTLISNSCFYGCDNLDISATDAPILETIDLTDFFRSSGITTADLSKWDLSLVVNINSMFRDTVSANPNVSTWDVGNVMGMGSIFRGATVANPDVSSWNVGNVMQMNGIFRDTLVANPDVSSWDVSSVILAQNMFRDAVANPDVSAWDTNSVMDMHSMFENALFANPDCSSWNVISLTDATDMFNGAALSTTNYDALLVAWEAQLVHNSVLFHAGTTKYNTGSPATARAALIADHSWTITDGGQV